MQWALESTAQSERGEQKVALHGMCAEIRTATPRGIGFGRGPRLARGEGGTRLRHANHNVANAVGSRNERHTDTKKSIRTGRLARHSALERDLALAWGGHLRSHFERAGCSRGISNKIIIIHF